MDESRLSPQNGCQYAHSIAFNLDGVANEYGEDLAGVSGNAAALEEPQDGGSSGARSTIPTTGIPGLVIERPNVSMDFAAQSNDYQPSSDFTDSVLKSLSSFSIMPHRERAMDFSYVGNSASVRGITCWVIPKKPSLRSLTLRPPEPTRPHGSGVYHRLPHDGSIRLLELLPGTSNQLIASKFLVARLDDRPSYEALSYVWGEAEASHLVTVNNNNLSATPNLVHALGRIRLPDRSRLIWVDQLCINQSDENEKRRQVQLMSRIYRSANRVLVWLGNDDTYVSNPAFHLICEVANFFLKSTEASFTSSDNIQPVPIPGALPEADARRWLFLQTLFDLNWFWRVWVIQEIALSATASLIWGVCEIEWKYVGLAAAYIRVHRSRIFQHCFMPGIFNAYFMYRISIAASGVFKPVSLSFLRLLTMTQQYDASDPRDRVYGLLGLPSADSGEVETPFIDPNYELDIQGVYRAVAIRIIEAEENLTLLSSVQHGPTFCSPQESWVPRWDRTAFTKSLLSGDSAHRHKADGGVPMVRSVSDHRTITVRGLNVGKVTSVLETMNISDFRITENSFVYNGVWQCNSRLLLVLQASDDKALLAYTLTAGKDYYGLLVEDEGTHMAAFDSWVVSRSDLRVSGTSLPPGVETTTLRAASTDNRVHKAVMRPRLPARTLRPQQPMLDTNNDQQDLELFPRSEQNDVNYSGTGNRKSFNESVCEQDHVLHHASSSLADDGAVWHFVEAAQNACNGRRIFLTEDGSLGLGPAAMREDDRLCILFGASVPFILRPEGQSWRLIGECYVKTLMSGQGVEKYKEGREDSTNFEIR